MSETELNEEEKAQLNTRLAEIYRRMQKLYKAYCDTQRATEQLIQDLKVNECPHIALLIEQMQLNTLLQLNLAEGLLLDKQNKLRPQDAEPLQCVFCDKKNFWEH